MSMLSAIKGEALEMFCTATTLAIALAAVETRFNFCILCPLFVTAIYGICKFYPNQGSGKKSYNKTIETARNYPFTIVLTDAVLAGSLYFLKNFLAHKEVDALPTESQPEPQTKIQISQSLVLDYLYVLLGARCLFNAVDNCASGSLSRALRLFSSKEVEGFSMAELEKVGRKKQE